MDFGLTDDQREIQRTARELLAERAKPERVREHAEAGTTDEALWKELRELGWPGHRDRRGARRPGPRSGRAVDPLRGAGPLAGAGSVPAERDGRDRDPAGRLRRAARALAARPRLRRDGRRARRPRCDGVAELVIGAARGGRLRADRRGRQRAASFAAEEAEVTPVDSVDPTRSTAARQRRRRRR